MRGSGRSISAWIRGRKKPSNRRTISYTVWIHALVRNRKSLTFLTHTVVGKGWGEVADSRAATRRLVLQSLYASAARHGSRCVIFMVTGYRLVGDIALHGVPVRIHRWSMELVGGRILLECSRAHLKVLLCGGGVGGGNVGRCGSALEVRVLTRIVAHHLIQKHWRERWVSAIARIGCAGYTHSSRTVQCIDGYSAGMRRGGCGTIAPESVPDPRVSDRIRTERGARRR